MLTDRSKLMVMVSALCAAAVIGAGPALPEEPAPTMFTIEDVYYYFAEGREASWGAHSLEPSAGVAGGSVPGFGQSLSDVYYHIADTFTLCNTTPEDVPRGQVFFCVEEGSWGVREGTWITPVPIPSPTPTPWAAACWVGATPPPRATS